MIDETLQFIVAELNRFFKLRYGLNENMVVLSGLVNMDGTPALQQDNRIVLTMINVEEERITAAAPGYASGNGQTSQQYAPVSIYLHLLFAGYFPGGNYTEALKFISGVLAFFQSKHIFLRSGYPAMPEYVDKLVFDLLKFTYQDLSHLWGMLGSKHMPSVGYRMRMLIIDENKLREQRPAISDPSYDLNAPKS
jgi:hypothetical protein